MSKPSAGTAYSEKESKVYDRNRFVSEGGKKIHEIELGVLKSAAALVSRKSRVLEVGCGTGRLLEQMCSIGFMVDGTDASPHMLAQCAEKVKARFPSSKLSHGEAARLPYPDSSYDFVYTIRLLNQTESPEYALDTISDMIRVARLGGHILVEFMNQDRPGFVRKSHSGVRLRTKDVVARAKERGCELVWRRGTFFLGMTSYQAVPRSFIGLVDLVDGALAPFPWTLQQMLRALEEKITG